MSQNDRAIEAVVPDAAIHEPVAVGSTEAHGINPNEHLTVARDRLRFLVQTEAAIRV